MRSVNKESPVLKPTRLRKGRNSGMKHVRGVNALATAAMLLAAMAACANSDQDPAGSPTPTSSMPTTANSTPTSDSAVASATASRLVRTYYAVRDELRQNPTAQLTKLSDVAISTELSAQEKLFKKERKDGLHQVGDTKVAELNLEGVDLDNSDPVAGRVPTVQVDVCYDVSGVDILDAQGKSVVTDKRPDTGWIRYLVSNYSYKADPTGSWRVASSQNLERTPCDPA